MNTSTVEQALRRLGELVVYPSEIELLLVGGAAGMLTGILARNRTTTDCDVIVCTPERAWTVVEAAAASVATQLDLPNRWLNSDVRMRIDTLPDGWERRRIPVGMFGRLLVFASSRPDLIAMKVIAGRPQDLDDLRVLKPRPDEKEFVRSHLQTLQGKGTPQDQIDDAFGVLNSLKVHDHE